MIPRIGILMTLCLAQICAGRHLRPRDKIPEIKAQAVLGEKVDPVSLGQFEGQYIVLVFYPLDFTFVCPTELIAFSESIEKFRELNAVVFGISTDSVFSHLAWIKTDRKQGGVGTLEYPLIADFSKKITRQFGFLVEDEDDELDGASLRGLVIIDGKGVIRHTQINDAPVGRSVDEVLRLIQAFQHTDKTGFVCPANWKPGKSTIIPDPQEKLKYFESTYDSSL